MQKHTALNLWTESVFVEADFRRAAGDVVNGQNVETQSSVFDMALGEKTLRGARDDTLLFRGYAEFGKRGKLVANRARAHFDERERFAVVPNQIQLALRAAARQVVARDELIAQLSQMPVRVSFAA